MTITPEMIERGAKALLALHGGQEAVENYPKMPPHIRERWASRARAVLEAGLERLRAAQGITDEIVEAAARAMYERRAGLWTDIKPPPWGTLPNIAHQEWREIARAGLKAAGTVTAVHLCDTCAQSKCWTRRDIEHACEDSQFPAKAVVVECGAYVADKRVGEVLHSAGEGA